MRLPRDRRRRPAAVALALVTGLLLAAAAVSGYAHSALADPTEFSTRTSAALDDADVRTVIADRAVRGLSGSALPDVLTVRPLLVPALAALADTSAFRRFFARQMDRRHRALTAGETTFSLDLPLDDGLVFESLRSVSPRVAAAIPPDLSVPVVRVDPHEAELAGARFLVDLGDLWWALLAAALAAAAGCAVLAGGARNALIHLGVAVAGAGLLVAGAVAGLGEFVVSHAAHAADLSDETERGAVRALWTALFADLRHAALLTALGATIVVVLAAGPLSTSYLAATLRRARRIVESDRRGVSLGRATALIALGAALVFEPTLAARALLVCAGVLIALIGAAQLSAGPSPDRTAPRARSRRALAVAGAMAGVLAATAVAVALVLPAPNMDTAESSAPGQACNGSVALCDRRLNEVVFPGTHNSYSAAEEPGWLFANQRHGIARQLRDGIRALLIDIHYGRRDPKNGLVRTDLAAEGSDRNKVARALGPHALKVAERLAGRVGQELPAVGRGAYFCHTLCELGAEPLGEQLALLREFLSANTREVIVLFVEPYVPAEEVERALDQADLLRHAAPLRRDAPLPTLGELVRADTRLVVLTEEDGGAQAWYLPGFSFAQDTPLGARKGSELTCAGSRGTADSPLFLLNHWLDVFPPPPSGNERIGGDFLERRLEQCERSRGLLPNLIAVDFYERTDVVQIAARRNAAGH